MMRARKGNGRRGWGWMTKERIDNELLDKCALFPCACCSWVPRPQSLRGEKKKKRKRQESAVTLFTSEFLRVYSLSLFRAHRAALPRLIQWGDGVNADAWPQSTSLHCSIVPVDPSLYPQSIHSYLHCNKHSQSHVRQTSSDALVRDPFPDHVSPPSVSGPDLCCALRLSTSPVRRPTTIRPFTNKRHT